VGDQASDFFALQGYELLVRVIPVELRAKIHGVNSRVISVHDEEVLGSE